MKPGFSVVETLREAIANITSVPVRTGAVMAAVAVLAGGAVGVAASDAAALESAWQKQVAAGAMTWKVSNGSGNPLSVQRCDALNTVTGVESSGSIMAAVNVFPATAPFTRVTMLTVSAGYLRAAFPGTDPGATVLAGADLVKRLGLVAGASFTYRLNDDGAGPVRTVAVDAAASQRGRIDGINDALLIVSPATGLSDSCLASVVPGAWSASAPLAQGWFPASDQPLVESVLRANDLVSNPDQALKQRAGRWVGVAAGGAVLIALIALWMARRGEFALYRMLGLSKRRMLLMLSVDTLLLALLPAQVAASILLLAFAGHTDPVVSVAWWESVKVLALMTLAPLAGVALLSRIDVLDSLKGK